ncbi:hypothetical protein [Bdellovibrio sp. BCCA]|uniref:hypothetical protein n=1 Tax=Bdellovibrio sp. BCCA TaxID=3136281 RepID=UPI0030F31C6B
MEKIMQTTVVVITLLLTLQATCFAADFQYVVKKGVLEPPRMGTIKLFDSSLPR